MSIEILDTTKDQLMNFLPHEVTRGNYWGFSVFTEEQVHKHDNEVISLVHENMTFHRGVWVWPHPEKDYMDHFNLMMGRLKDLSERGTAYAFTEGDDGMIYAYDCNEVNIAEEEHYQVSLDFILNEVVPHLGNPPKDNVTNIVHVGTEEVPTLKYDEKDTSLGSISRIVVADANMANAATLLDEEHEIAADEFIRVGDKYVYPVTYYNTPENFLGFCEKIGGTIFQVWSYKGHTYIAENKNLLFPAELSNIDNVTLDDIMSDLIELTNAVKGE